MIWGGAGCDRPTQNHDLNTTYPDWRTGDSNDKLYTLHETCDAHARLAAGAGVGAIVLKP